MHPAPVMFNRSKRQKYNFNTLTVGEHFEIPCHPQDKNHLLQRMHSAANGHNRYHNLDRHYRIEITEIGVRCTLAALSKPKPEPLNIRVFKKGSQ